MIRFVKDVYDYLRFGFTKRAPRMKLTNIVSLAYPFEKGDEEAYKIAALCNVSSSGIQVESFEIYPVGKEVVIKCNLPWSSIFIDGKIVRTKDNKYTRTYGIKFINKRFNKVGIKRLLKFVRSEIKRQKKEKAETKRLLKSVEVQS